MQAGHLELDPVENRRQPVLTIGHSTRKLEELIRLLKLNGVTRLADIRTIPRSRYNPQFNKDTLPLKLRDAGMDYQHMPGLGGLRHPGPDSTNTAWRNAGFRGFADYMETEEFEANLQEIIHMAERETVCLMCAESMPWRCHRSLVADALLARGIPVEHIISETSRRKHKLTPWAQIHNGRVVYSLTVEQVREKEQSMASKWLDVSVPVHHKMVHWPGDPPVSIKQVSDVAKGDSHTLSEICFGSHTGTHVDAPAHFLAEGTSIDKVSLNILVGRARVIEIENEKSITPAELVSHRLRRGERILFKTRNSSFAWQSDKFVEDFVYLSKEATDFLVARGVILVGIDYLSVGGYKRGDGSYVHRTLLGNGVILIEGLNLSLAGPGKYELVCLPLKLENGDGAPARAILRQIK